MSLIHNELYSHTINTAMPKAAVVAQVKMVFHIVKNSLARIQSPQQRLALVQNAQRTFASLNGMLRAWSLRKLALLECKTTDLCQEGLKTAQIAKFFYVRDCRSFQKMSFSLWFIGTMEMQFGAESQGQVTLNAARIVAKLFVERVDGRAITLHRIAETQLRFHITYNDGVETLVQASNQARRTLLTKDISDYLLAIADTAFTYGLVEYGTQLLSEVERVNKTIFGRQMSQKAHADLENLKRKFNKG